MLFPDAKLIILTKAPIPGLVKTRLISTLGMEGAAKLHQQMLEQKLHLSTQQQLAAVDLYCAPDREHPYFKAIQHRFPIELHSQRGDDLGRRMGHALQQTLSKCQYAILIGTDCPPLHNGHLQQAFQSLEEGSDVVLGPAEDGGYVLIGLRRFDWSLFNNMHWGQNTVFEQTRSRIVELGWKLTQLETLWDVDLPEDLERYKTFFSSVGEKPHQAN